MGLQRGFQAKAHHLYIEFVESKRDEGGWQADLFNDNNLGLLGDVLWSGGCWVGKGSNKQWVLVGGVLPIRKRGRKINLALKARLASFLSSWLSREVLELPPQLVQSTSPPPESFWPEDYPRQNACPIHASPHHYAVCHCLSECS